MDKSTLLDLLVLSLAVDGAGNCDKPTADWFWLPGLYLIPCEYLVQISAHCCIPAAPNVGTPWL